MIAGAIPQARWNCAAPRRALAPKLLARILRSAFPHRRAVHVEPLAGGLRNANFQVALDGPPGLLVLRVYEHDRSLCRKEIDIFRLLADSVRVPEVLHAEPEGMDGVPPFTLSRFIDGISFHQLKHTGCRETLAQAARSAGQTLAAIGRFRFDRAGWLGPGPAVTAPLLPGRDPLPRFIDLCLAHPLLQQRVPADTRDEAHQRAWRWAPRLAGLDSSPRLVHGDFNRRNLLVRPVAGRWQVAAVLDWEFAVSGSPLADVGNFLRYEKAAAPIAEPHFSDGYRDAAGDLPEDWRPLSRMLSLAAICESLTHGDLPPPIAAELAQLLAAHCRPG